MTLPHVLTPLTVGFVKSNVNAPRPNCPIDVCDQGYIRTFVPGGTKDFIKAIGAWREAGIPFVITNIRGAQLCAKHGIELRHDELEISI